MCAVELSVEMSGFEREGASDMHPSEITFGHIWHRMAPLYLCRSNADIGGECADPFS
jgi:hypothetical protein